MLYYSEDYNRENRIIETDRELELRSPFRRDLARLIHSPAFRRLQGKTQLFPGIESDFFRNRLTHSLEVAQIAKSIAIRINATNYSHKDPSDKIDLDLIEFAALAHDLGHPPFGHTGEEALDKCMINDGGFEGNAQTIRILSKLEKKGEVPTDYDQRIGLNLTYRTLASVLKYDVEIPIKNADRTKEDKLEKGYYKSERELINNIKKNVINCKDYKGEFKSIECQIMDIADDIAYSTYDLEDALKAEFISPLEILNDTSKDELMALVAEKVSKKLNLSFTSTEAGKALSQLFGENVFLKNKIIEELKDKKTEDEQYVAITKSALKAYDMSLLVTKDGYMRNNLTSRLVDKFINGFDCSWNSVIPTFSSVNLSNETLRSVETLKNYTFVKLTESPRLKVASYRGKEIVTVIFEALDDGGSALLPKDFKDIYDATLDDTKKDE